MVMHVLISARVWLISGFRVQGMASVAPGRVLQHHTANVSSLIWGVVLAMQGETVRHAKKSLVLTSAMVMACVQEMELACALLAGLGYSAPSK